MMNDLQIFLIQNRNTISKMLLSLFYTVDAIKFDHAGSDERSFFREQAAKKGMNFMALGRLCVGEYIDVKDFLQRPQIRSNFLGPTRLKPSRMPRHFLLFLDDPKHGEDPRKNPHQVLHDFFFHTVINDAQQRLKKNPGEFKKYSTDYIDAYRRAGSPRKKADILPLASKMAIRYVLHALYDIIPTDEELAVWEKLFYTGGITELYLTAAVVPLAHVMCCCLDGRSELFNEAVEMIEKSPVLSSYSPSDTVLSLTRREMAELLVSLTGTAGILGIASLAVNICALFPRDYKLDISNQTMVLRSVLECARLFPPVSEFNAVLEEETEYQVGGRPVKFPAGTEVCVVLLLASYDPSVFPNPTKFDPMRDNLFTHTVNFNTVGYSAKGSGVRTCPGRNLAIAMNSEVLIHLVKTDDSYVPPTERSRLWPW